MAPTSGQRMVSKEPHLSKKDHFRILSLLPAILLSAFIRPFIGSAGKGKDGIIRFWGLVLLSFSDSSAF